MMTDTMTEAVRYFDAHPEAWHWNTNKERYVCTHCDVFWAGEGEVCRECGRDGVSVTEYRANRDAVYRQHGRVYGPY